MKKQTSTEAHIPTILVVFGATGDLMKKKIIPAVYHLAQNKKIGPLFHIVGMARKDISTKDFQKDVIDHLYERIPKLKKRNAQHVSKTFSYIQGDFSDAKSFVRLKSALKNIDDTWGVCTNKLFYLAVPPNHFKDIFTHMARVGLNTPCGGDFGWTRVLIEKPFGRDLHTAKKLHTLLKKFFVDEQLYFIDHYLAKEIVQAITHFRFSNNIFETSWDKESIERITVRLLETIGAEDRGAFYDAVGAFRDVGQNHMLQMLSAVTMKYPRDMGASELRRRRAEIIDSLEPWTHKRIKEQTFRAQYKTYGNIEGITKNSDTETYIKLQTQLTHPSWAGVPIVLEAGKRMKESVKEVEVLFRHPALCVACTPDNHIHNKVVFKMEPDDKITIHFWTKVPGFEKKLEERTFTFFLYERSQKVQYVEEYAKLLFSAIAGDQSMFVSEQEIEAEWKFTDPVISAWRKNIVPLASYTPNTEEATQSAAHIGAEIMPKIPPIPKEMAIIGLGKMGANMAKRMMNQGWRVVGHNRTAESTNELIQEGLVPAYSIEEVIEALPKKKIIWLMVPSGKPVDDILFGKDGLTHYLRHGDIVIDGGNSFYEDSSQRAKKLQKYGITFLDVGTSGGPLGARHGACLMIGGKKKDFQTVEVLFRDFALPDGYQFFEGYGAGHFVKMVHNGIEYGMMQALAEGFTMMKKTKFQLDLTRVADVYNHGSVIESRLVGWLKDAFQIYGEDLNHISGSIQQLGEGAWTVRTAKEMKIKVKVIEEALRFRYHSKKNPNYTGKIVSALRGQFGGHTVIENKK